MGWEVGSVGDGVKGDEEIKILGKRKGLQSVMMISWEDKREQVSVANHACQETELVAFQRKD